MKIALLSDTHIRKGGTLPRNVWDEIAQSDMIIHAGDLVSESLLDDLAVLVSVVVVKGNCDWTVNSLPDKIITQFGGLRVGITHGHLGKGSTTPERAYNLFRDDGVDIVVFGHSHAPYNKYHNGVLLFNPGSPTNKRNQPMFSMGVLNVFNDRFEIDHLFF